MTGPDRNYKRLHLLSALVLIVVFVFGIASGFALCHLFTKRSTQPAERGLGLAPASLEALDLTPEQRQQAYEIGEKYRGKLEAIRRQIAPKIRTIHQKMRAQMEIHLTPTQRSLQKKLEEQGRFPQLIPKRAIPPAEAVKACSGKKQADPCYIDAPQRQIDGSCRNVPTPDSPLACVPHSSPGL